ncbi:hypothetical protein L204_105804 [Cryptococcus depauperatus]|nr:mutanase [Cryptococcus depauperatus CBS 7855]
MRVTSALLSLLLGSQLATSAHAPDSRRRHHVINRAAGKQNPSTITDKVVWKTVFVTKTVWDDDLPTSTAAAVSNAAELVAGAISTTSAAPTTVASGTKSKTADSASVTGKSGLLPDGIIAKAAALGLTLSAGINLSTAQRSPTTTSTPPATTTVSGPKKVFAHFMVGIVSTYENADWVADMQLAKEKGIDGFALNIGVDPYTQQQLDLAYAAGASVGNFDLFISFDFNWYKLPDTGGVADMLKRYKDSPAQYRVDGKPFVSTFIGDSFNFVEVAQQVGEPIYAVPCWQPSAENVNNAGVSGLFSWAAWAGQLDNVPVDAEKDTSQDLAYLKYTEAAGKTYMAPVSPWFSTHFGKEVSYSKNWVFKGETLWKTRWDQILELGSRLNFLEIITWNDYGESHHVGPYNTPHTDDSSSLWASGLDHAAMLDFAIPYIKAFKAGSSVPIIEQEQLVYWYRPHLKDVSCDSTDNCGSKPTGWEFLQDTVFVSTQTKEGGLVKITSGNNPPVVQTVDAGVQMIEVPMSVGQQTFEFVTWHGGHGQSTSNVSVIDTCWNGIYNFNYHSGSITC